MDSWPNQEALNKALNNYRTYMRAFIISNLKKIPGRNVEEVVIDSLDEARQTVRADEIERTLHNSDRDIKSIIDINDFPHLVNVNWKKSFKIPLTDDKTFRNQLWLIKDGRDQDWAHPPESDAEYEATRAHLFLIADVLGKINNPEAKRKIEQIRDECLSDNAAKLISEISEKLETVETQKKKYKMDFEKVEKQLKDLENEHNANKEQLKTIQTQLTEVEGQKRIAEEQLTTKTRDLKAAEDLLSENHDCLTTTSNQLEKIKAQKTSLEERLTSIEKQFEDEKQDYKDRVTSIKDQLAAVKLEKKDTEKCLLTMRNHLTTVAIDNQIFPSLSTDSAVRILDRRNTDKKEYLLELLELRQPSIIYVQSEEKINLLLKHIAPEKAEVIGKHNEQTSGVEERELLEKLGNGDLIAVVSDAIFSSLSEQHCIEHFVFPDLSYGIDTFFNRCHPAFTSKQGAFLHLIYDCKKDMKWITQKYPDRETLKKFYIDWRNFFGVNENFVKPENFRGKLNITKLEFESNCFILEELGFIERNKEGIKLLPDVAEKELDESVTYCTGEKLKREITEFQKFQIEHSVEQIWEKILENQSIENKQIIPEPEEERTDSEDSEFWAPIRNGDFGELFAGKPVPLSNDGWIQKSICNIGILLYLNKHNCYTQLLFIGDGRIERRDQIMKLFPESDYTWEYRDSPKEAKVRFPVLDKGKNERDDWDEIREKLVTMGTDIYNKIRESGSENMWTSQ